MIGISGKGGQKIREIQEKSGAYIKVYYACLNCASHIFPSNFNSFFIILVSSCLKKNPFFINILTHQKSMLHTCTNEGIVLSST